MKSYRWIVRGYRWKQWRRIKLEQKETGIRRESIYSSVRRMTADKKREQAQLEEDRKKEERFLRER